MTLQTAQHDKGSPPGQEFRNTLLATKEAAAMAKGIEKSKKDNKPKLSTKEKQKKKKEKQATK
jgi:hypothetical protein